MVLVLCEMRSASSRIWTRVTVSISYDDNHCTTGTSSKSIIIGNHNYIITSVIKFKIIYLFIYLSIFFTRRFCFPRNDFKISARSRQISLSASLSMDSLRKPQRYAWMRDGKTEQVLQPAERSSLLCSNSHDVHNIQWPVWGLLPQGNGAAVTAMVAVVNNTKKETSTHIRAHVHALTQSKC